MYCCVLYGNCDLSCVLLASRFVSWCTCDVKHVCEQTALLQNQLFDYQSLRACVYVFRRAVETVTGERVACTKSQDWQPPRWYLIHVRKRQAQFLNQRQYWPAVIHTNYWVVNRIYSCKLWTGVQPPPYELLVWNLCCWSLQGIHVYRQIGFDMIHVCKAGTPIMHDPVYPRGDCVNVRCRRSTQLWFSMKVFCLLVQIWRLRLWIQN